MNSLAHQFEAMKLAPATVARLVGIPESVARHHLERDPAQLSAIWRHARVRRIQAHIAAMPGRSYCFPEARQ